MWHAYCPTLLAYGAATWGTTREEVLAHIGEMAGMIVERLVEEGAPIRSLPTIRSRPPESGSWSRSMRPSRTRRIRREPPIGGGRPARRKAAARARPAFALRRLPTTAAAPARAPVFAKQPHLTVGGSGREVLPEFLPGYLSCLIDDRLPAVDSVHTSTGGEPGAGRDPASPLDTDMKAESRAAARPAGIRVLVAEDEAVIAFDLEKTLRSLGCSVRGTVASGAGAAGAGAPGAPGRGAARPRARRRLRRAARRFPAGRGRAVRALDRLPAGAVRRPGAARGARPRKPYHRVELVRALATVKGTRAAAS